MAFNREAAKQAGYTDAEIDAYLASKSQPESPLAAAAGRAVQTGQEHLDAATPGRTLTELGGGIVGAAVAGKVLPGTQKVGQTLGAGVARMTGAGLGGAAAELGYQGATGEALDPEKAVSAGGRQLAFEGVGQAVMRAINRLIKPSRVGVEASTEKAATAFKEVGGEFLPHQLIPEHKGFGLATGIAQGGVGGGRIDAVLKKQSEALKPLSERIADKLADQSVRELDDSEIGALLVDTIEGGKGAYEAAGTKMYQALDQASGGVKVSMVPVVEAAEAELKSFAGIKNVGKSGGLSQMMKRLISFSKIDAKSGVRTFEDLSFEQAQELRSELAAVKRKAVNPKERRAYAKMVSVVDDAMEQSASGSPELVENWRAVNAFYKDGKRVFDNKFMARLLNETMAAEKVGEAIAASGNVTTIKQVQEALKYAKGVDPSLDTGKAMDAVRAGWFSNITAGSAAQGELSGGVLSAKLSNPKVQRTMRALYTTEQREAIMQFADVAKRIQTAPKGGGDVLIKLTQAGQGAAVGAMLFGGSAASPVAVPVLMAPKLLARLLTSPKIAGWLTRGAKLPTGSPAGAGLISRILHSAAELAESGELTLPADWQPPAAMQPGSPASMIQAR